MLKRSLCANFAILKITCCTLPPNDVLSQHSITSKSIRQVKAERMFTAHETASTDMIKHCEQKAHRANENSIQIHELKFLITLFYKTHLFIIQTSLRSMYNATWRCNPEDKHRYIHCFEKLRSRS